MLDHFMEFLENQLRGRLGSRAGWLSYYRRGMRNTVVEFEYSVGGEAYKESCILRGDPSRGELDYAELDNIASYFASKYQSRSARQIGVRPDRVSLSDFARGGLVSVGPTRVNLGKWGFGEPRMSPFSDETWEPRQKPKEPTFKGLMTKMESRQVTTKEILEKLGGK